MVIAVVAAETPVVVAAVVLRAAVVRAALVVGPIDVCTVVGRATIKISMVGQGIRFAKSDS